MEISVHERLNVIILLRFEGLFILKPYKINIRLFQLKGMKMRNYVIFTDSSCDLSQEMLKTRGVECASLTFRFDGDNKEYSNNEMPIKAFYDKMRNGGVAKTAATNSEDFAKGFEEILKSGNDVLYIGFSSGLSTTFNSARLAAEDLKEKYPEGKIICVDTLAASAGIALLIDMVIEKKNHLSVMKKDLWL